jgi:hypothetical protein
MWRADEQSEIGVTESREAFVARLSAFAVDALAGRWTVWLAEDDTDGVVANTGYSPSAEILELEFAGYEG